MPKLNEALDYTALAITLFAGVIGENMHILGREVVKERKEEIIANNKIIDWLFAGGDV